MNTERTILLQLYSKASLAMEAYPVHNSFRNLPPKLGRPESESSGPQEQKRQHRGTETRPAAKLPELQKPPTSEEIAERGKKP